MKYTLTLLTLVFALFLSPVLAQEATPFTQKPTNPKVEAPDINLGLVKLPSMMDCGKREALENITNRYEEVPFTLSNGFIMTPGGQLVVGQTIMYLNPEHGTYTIIQYFAEASEIVDGCIVHTGVNFQPMQIKPKGTNL